MAYFQPIADWPGGIVYKSAHGRIYCAAPHGLIPEAPYTIAALRPPTPEEQQGWGPGVLPRMVLDVTSVEERALAASIRDRTLAIAPWNAYLVLRLDNRLVIVAYQMNAGIRRLDATSAPQVAIAGGHDVAGWSTETIRHQSGERWMFTPPKYEPISASWPTTRIFGN